MKKVIISSIVVIVLLIAVFTYMNYRSRTLSPPASVSHTNGLLTVSIDYSRPSVRGRVIFGTKEKKALQPYGEYWRLGANESTEIDFNKDVLFNGETVKTGRYRIYAIPGNETFEIVLNTALGTWGAFSPKADQDLIRTKVPVENLTTPTEQFTITMQSEGDSIQIRFEWERVGVTLPIQVQAR